MVSAISPSRSSSEEVAFIAGLDEGGGLQIDPDHSASSQAANPAFDVTPGHLVSGIITERGVCSATEEGLLGLFPEQRHS